MSFLLTQRHIGLYISDPDFLYGQIRQPPDVVQEDLADIKRSIREVHGLPNFFLRFGIRGEKSSKNKFSADEIFMEPEAEGTDT